MLDFLQLPYMQRAALEIVLLAPIAGLVGAHVVLRRLAFFTHAVGACSFPGLVVSVPLGIPPQLGALGVGGASSLLIDRLGRRDAASRDAAVALVLVAALAIGVVLASDVVESTVAFDQLLFGSVLGIGGRELTLTALALIIVTALALRFRREWIDDGFDASGEADGDRAKASWALLGAVTVASIIALDAVGALLVSSLLVVPAVIVRPFASSVVTLEAGTAVSAAVLGLAGLAIAHQFDVPPGAATAVLGAAAFVVGASLAARRSHPGGADDV
jgi:ABC-type Mn2+/Zn2+ transport system permease subunit